MRSICFTLLAFCAFTSFSQSIDTPQRPSAVQFEENRGQVKDQYAQPRTDVLFSGTTQGVQFHIRANGISYQLSRANGGAGAEQSQGPAHTASGSLPVAAEITSHRIDIDWVAAETDPAFGTAGENPAYTNYYNVPQNTLPALMVKSFSSVNFKNVWSGVDLEYHARSGDLESDWTMQHPEDHTKIKFKVSGADLRVDEAGYLIMTTPLGSIREGRLIATQQGKARDVRWVLDGNTVSISADGLDANVPLVIDPPTRLWGTYMGGTGYEWPWSVENDGAGGVYVAGSTASSANIATTGAHQVSYWGQFDAFLSHFGANGIPLWSTYYGGSEDDFGRDCSVSPINGDVYFSGATISGTGIATPGAHQEFPCGTLDAFLVRFNAAGIRVWGTYYCGTDIEEGNACSVDALGNLYMVGWSRSLDSIATPGSIQSVHGGPDFMDAFLVKFDTAGVRQWATYVGGSGEDRAYDCRVDGQGAVYISGSTQQLPSNATVGGHQATFGGYEDAFLQKYDSDGGLLWGTYYGGPDLDTWGYCAVDDDHVYLAGTTLSESAIATPGAYQEIATSPGQFDDDAFLVQFDHLGQRNWATYLGGPAGDAVQGITTDGNGSVLICGWTTSTSGIASSGSYDTTLDAWDEGFLAKFTRTGALHWSTYYGGLGNDVGKGCAAMGGDVVYMVGNSFSSTSIASPGAHDTTNDGPNDMFLVKFDGCDRGPIDLQPNAVAHCGLESMDLTVNGGLECTWRPSDGLSDTFGNSVVASPTASTMYYARHIDTNGCAAVDSVWIDVTIIDTAVVVSSVTLNAAQQNASYQWFNCDSATAIPGATGQSYAISSSGSYAVVLQLNGCVDTTACVQVMSVGLIESLAGSAYHLAPNPTTGALTVYAPSVGTYRIELYDHAGRRVYAERFISDRPTLFIGDLPAGVYWMRINGTAGIKVVKL